MCTHQWLRKISKYLIYKIVSEWVACKHLSKFLRAPYLLYIHWPLKCFLTLASQELPYCKTVWFTSVNRMMYNLVTSFILIHFNIIGVFSIIFLWGHMDLTMGCVECDFYLLLHYVHSACSAFWEINIFFVSSVARHFSFLLLKQKSTAFLFPWRAHSSVGPFKRQKDRWAVQRKFQLWEIKHLFCI